MSILSIGALDNDPAAVYVNNRKAFAMRESFYSKEDFPINALKAVKPRYDTVDAVAITNVSHLKTLKTKINDIIDSKVILVNGREALVKSALVTNNNPSSAAILLEDENGLAVGYYENNKIKWLNKYHKPNDLQTFLNTVTNLNSLRDVDEMLWSSFAGSDRYVDIIQNVFLRKKEEDFIVHPSVATSEFILTTDPHITHSAVTVLIDVVVNLLQWLKTETQMDTLVVAGYSANNFLLMDAIDEFFDKVITIPSTMEASRTLGAAAILEPFDWYDAYVGIKPEDDDFADATATKLLQHEIVETTYGAVNYGTSYLGNYSVLSVPMPDNIETIKQTYNIPRFEPLNVFVSEKDYDRFFEGKKCYNKPTIAKVIGGNYNVPYCKVTCTNMTSNPFVNRILEKTRNSQFPILIGYSREQPGSV